MLGNRPARRTAAGLTLALLLSAATPAIGGTHRVEPGNALEAREPAEPARPDWGIRSPGSGAVRMVLPARRDPGSGAAASLGGWRQDPAPLAGVRIKISGSPMAGSVAGFALSPDGSRAVFIANKDTVGLFELYSVPVDGSAAPVKISAGLPFGAGDQGVSAFRISPDSARVVFLADAHHTGGVSDIYSAPIDGSSAAIRLNVNNEAPVTGFGITPDSAHAIFLGLNTASAVLTTEIYATGIATVSAPRQLSDVYLSNAAGDVVAAIFSPNGARVVYAADAGADEIYQWYSVATAALSPGTDVQLSASFTSVSQASISPDSGRVVYTGDDTTSGKWDVYSIPIAGGARLRLNPPMTGVGASAIAISPDGQRVGYLADQNTLGVTEIYSAAILTAASGVRLNTPLSGSQSAVSLNITPDNARMLYEADQTTPGTVDLFAAPLAGGSAPSTLHGLTPPADAGRFTGLGTPIIGRRAVYPVFGSAVSIFSVRYDGSLPFQQISLAMSPGDTLRDAFLPTAATRLMAYGIGPVTSTVTDEVTLVSTRGDLPGEMMNPLSLGTALGVLAYEIASDERYAVYLQDADTTGKPELYSYEPDSDGDGALNGSDNCLFVSNPSQGPALFGPTLVAQSSTVFSWGETFDVRFVRGLLSKVKLLEIQTSGVLLEASGFTEPATPPIGDGFYYLVAHDCPGRSWQTATGAEPQRDVVFP